MPEGYARLLRLRLRWYSSESARVLQRHWQWLLLATVLLPMGMTTDTLLRLCAYPLVALLAAGREVPVYLFWLLLIELVALMWVGWQRGALRGGPFMHYAATLPMAPRLTRAVDMTLVLLADGLLLLPLLAALIDTATDAQAATLRALLALGALLGCVLSLQLLLLERRYGRLAAMSLANLPLALGLARPDSPLAGLLPVASVVLLYVFWRLPGPRTRPPRRLLAQVAMPTGARALLPIFLRIQLRALLARPVHTLLWGGALTALALGLAGLLQRFDYDQRALPTAVIGAAFMALIAASAYRTLRAAHAPMGHYLASLPVSRHYWLLRDLGLVALLASLPLARLLWALTQAPGVPARALLGLTLAFFLLLALLRLPLGVAGRQTVLANLLLTALWTGLMLALVTH